MSRTCVACRRRRPHGLVNAGFTGAFLPPGNDTRVVIDQVTDPVSDPGDCCRAGAYVTVSHGLRRRAAPAPCQVPSFVFTSSTTASGTWTGPGSMPAISLQGPKEQLTRSFRKPWSGDLRRLWVRHRPFRTRRETAMNAAAVSRSSRSLSSCRSCSSSCSASSTSDARFCLQHRSNSAARRPGRDRQPDHRRGRC